MNLTQRDVAFLVAKWYFLSMFWRVSNLATTSPVDNLLDKGDFTLEQLLDEDDLIQECKSLNKRLVTFLRGKAQVAQLVGYIVEDSPADANDHRIFKYPFVSCEIFTCEIDQLFNTLLENLELLDLLFSFVDSGKTHSNLLSGYFSKVVICLLVRRTPDMMAYLETHQDILEKLVSLIGITSIMEVIMKLVGADDQILMYHADSIQWLASTNLLEMLVDRLSPQYSADEHANAADTLCAVARTAPSALAAQLSKPRYIGHLFQHVLEAPQAKTGVIHSLSVCITLLDPKRAASAAAASAARGIHQPLQPANPETVDGMLQRLGDLLQVLDLSSDETVLLTTYGQLRPPLGIHRLKVVEFIAVLLRTNSDVARQELVRLGAIRTALDLFFRFPFNNMLHHHVEGIVNSCLDSNSLALIEHLFVECNFLNRLLAANNQPDAPDTRPEPRAEAVRGPSRCGFLGHVTRMSNKLVQVASTNPGIDAYLQENKQWVHWQSSNLQQRNQLENVFQWTCGRPASMDDRPGDSDDDDVSRDRDFDISTISLASNLPREFHRYGMLDADEVDAEYEGAERAMAGLRVSEDIDSDEEECETSNLVSATIGSMNVVESKTDTENVAESSNVGKSSDNGGGGEDGAPVTWFPFEMSGKGAPVNTNEAGFLSEPMVLEFPDLNLSNPPVSHRSTVEGVEEPTFSFSVLEHYLNPMGPGGQAVNSEILHGEELHVDLFANVPRSVVDNSVNKAPKETNNYVGNTSVGESITEDDDIDDFDVRGNSGGQEVGSLSSNRPVVIFGEVQSAETPLTKGAPSGTSRADFFATSPPSFALFGSSVKAEELPAQVEFSSQPNLFASPPPGGTISVWPPVFPERPASPSSFEEFSETNNNVAVETAAKEKEKERDSDSEREEAYVQQDVVKEDFIGDITEVNPTDELGDTSDLMREGEVPESVDHLPRDLNESQRLADERRGLTSLEPEGTAKAMEKALREGIVDEAVPMKLMGEYGNSIIHSTVDSNEKTELDASFNDANFWKTTYGEGKGDDRGEEPQPTVELDLNQGGKHTHPVKVGGLEKDM